MFSVSLAHNNYLYLKEGIMFWHPHLRNSWFGVFFPLRCRAELRILMAKRGQRADEVRWQIGVKHEQPAHNKRVHCVTIFLLFPGEWAEWFKEEQMETAANRWVLEWIQATLLAGTWEFLMAWAFPTTGIYDLGPGRCLSVCIYEDQKKTPLLSMVWGIF